MVTSAVEQIAPSHLLFRAVNERIAELARIDGPGTSSFICECSNDECAESIEVTPAEYLAVRMHSDRFLVLPGHQPGRDEHVVEANDRFVVVEKAPLGPAFAAAG